MKSFAYARAADPASALALMSGGVGSAKFLGGGTNLIDLMRENIEQPDRLVDITRLPLDRIEELPTGGLRIGALVRNSQLAAHPAVRQRYPMLSQAILMGASAQLRNMATTGGNLMQRTRCYYFYDETARCNKRATGAGCDAFEGLNRIHAVLGTSPLCIAPHPSDMCVALAALDATVRISGPDGDREVALVNFHRLPGETPELETQLRADELITAVDLPLMPFARHSTYRKIRDRASYAFALVSVGAALEIADGTIAKVRIALGGVATKPWRAFRAEAYLIGKTPCADVFREAAELEFGDAKPLRHNAFKVELAGRTLVSVLEELAQMKDTP